jgi:hypothetical protein
LIVTFRLLNRYHTGKLLGKPIGLITAGKFTKRKSMRALKKSIKTTNVGLCCQSQVKQYASVRYNLQ